MMSTVRREDGRSLCGKRHYVRKGSIMTSVATNEPRPFLGSWLSQELDRLEAPDKTFMGHRDILTRSLARYHFVAPYLRGVALDIGCGRGYGFDVIRHHSSKQIGVDVSFSFLRDARASEPDRPLALASGEHLPFSQASFDSIISFEVIEHIKDDVMFLRDLRRLARRNAFIAISTPNRLIVSGDAAKPLNPFHVREYTADDFIRLLRQEFSTVTVFGQHEGPVVESGRSGLIDRVPVRLKYMVPTHIQGVLSVMVRTPLRLEDCRFDRDALERSHTFVALCSV
jgi:SAM-dependent methyltransferase